MLPFADFKASLNDLSKILFFCLNGLTDGMIAALWVAKLKGFVTDNLKLETMIENCGGSVKSKKNAHSIIIYIVHGKITDSLRGFLKHSRNPALNIKTILDLGLDSECCALCC